MQLKLNFFCKKLKLKPEFELKGFYKTKGRKTLMKKEKKCERIWSKEWVNVFLEREIFLVYLLGYKVETAVIYI